MAQGSVKDTTGYVNYVYNISARGTTQVASQLMGLSGVTGSILGQLAFQTSSYLSTTEGALLSMGIVASAGFAKATQQAVEFDQALATIGAISGKTTSEVSGLGEEAMSMSAKFGVAVSEMTQGLESLARAGVSTNNMNSILEQAMGLSKLEGLSLETAINDLISTTNLLDTKGLDLESPEYAEAVKYQNQKITATSEAAPINAQDIIHTLEHIGGYASSTNLDQDDLYAVIAQLGSKGTKSEMAGTSLRAFISAGQKDTAQRALARIGLTVDDLWKNDETILSITDMKDVLDEAMEAKGYTKQEKLEFYSDFAGYKQANQIMKIDTQSAREFKEKIDRSWDMSAKIQQVIGTAETNIRGLVQAGTNFLTKVGEPLLPIVSVIAGTAKNIIEIINKIPGTNFVIAGGLVLASVKAVSTIFNKIAPQLLAAKGNAFDIQELFRGMRENLADSFAILKNINNMDWLKKQSIWNESQRVTEDDKVLYWREKFEKSDINVNDITDVYSLEKGKDYTSEYIRWKYNRTVESQQPVEEPDGTDNRTENKKASQAPRINEQHIETIVNAINRINKTLQGFGKSKPKKEKDDTKETESDNIQIENKVALDDSIISKLKNSIFKVEVVNATRAIPVFQVSSSFLKKQQQADREIEDFLERGTVEKYPRLKSKSGEKARGTASYTQKRVRLTDDSYETITREHELGHALFSDPNLKRESDKIKISESDRKQLRGTTLSSKAYKTLGSIVNEYEADLFAMKMAQKRGQEVPKERIKRIEAGKKILQKHNVFSDVRSDYVEAMANAVYVRDSYVQQKFKDPIKGIPTKTAAEEKKEQEEKERLERERREKERKENKKKAAESKKRREDFKKEFKPIVNLEGIKNVDFFTDIIEPTNKKETVKFVMSEKDIENFINAIDIDFGFDLETLEGQKAQKMMLNHFKEIALGNIVGGDINVKGLSEENLLKEIDNELTKYIGPAREQINNLVMMQHDGIKYTSKEMEEKLSVPKAFTTNKGSQEKSINELMNKLDSNSSNSNSLTEIPYLSPDELDKPNKKVLQDLNDALIEVYGDIIDSQMTGTSSFSMKKEEMKSIIANNLKKVSEATKNKSNEKKSLKSLTKTELLKINDELIKEHTLPPLDKVDIAMKKEDMISALQNNYKRISENNSNLKNEKPLPGKKELDSLSKEELKNMHDSWIEKYGNPAEFHEIDITMPPSEIISKLEKNRARVLPKQAGGDNLLKLKQKFKATLTDKLATRSAVTPEPFFDATGINTDQLTQGELLLLATASGFKLDFDSYTEDEKERRARKKLTNSRAKPINVKDFIESDGDFERQNFGNYLANNIGAAKLNLRALQGSYSNKIANLFLNDLNAEAQQTFIKELGLNNTNPYAAMGEYLTLATIDDKKVKNLSDEEKKKLAFIQGNQEQHLNRVKELGNIIEYDPDKLHKESDRYRNSLKNGPNVYSNPNESVERSILLDSTNGIGGLNLHAKKITDRLLEFVMQQAVGAIKEELESQVGHTLTIDQVLEYLPNLHVPYRRKYHPHQLSNFNNDDLEATIKRAKQTLHDSIAGGEQDYSTFGAKQKGIGKAKFVPYPGDNGTGMFVDNHGGRIFGKEEDDLKSRTLQDIIRDAKFEEQRKAARQRGVAKITGLKATFEGQNIDMYSREEASHGRNFQNTKVLDPDSGELLGFEANDYGDIREGFNWALERRRNRIYVQNRQIENFGVLAYKYGLSRKKIMNSKPTEAQEKKIQELYDSQKFVDINQYINDYGWDAFVQLRGQMAKSNIFRRDNKTGQIDLSSGKNVFRTWITPQEYEERLAKNLIYTGNGNQGILKTKKDKETGQTLYQVEDYESLHYSMDDIKAKVLTEDIAWQKEMESIFKGLDKRNMKHPERLAEQILRLPQSQIKKTMNAISMYDEKLGNDLIKYANKELNDEIEQAKLLGITNIDFLTEDEILPKDFAKKKRGYLNKEDRDFLLGMYDLDVSNATNAKEENWMIRDQLDAQGLWKEAVTELYGHSIGRSSRKVIFEKPEQPTKEDFTKPSDIEDWIVNNFGRDALDTITVADMQWILESKNPYKTLMDHLETQQELYRMRNSQVNIGLDDGNRYNYDEKDEDEFNNMMNNLWKDEENPDYYLQGRIEQEQGLPLENYIPEEVKQLITNEAGDPDQIGESFARPITLPTSVIRAQEYYNKDKNKWEEITNSNRAKKLNTLLNSVEKDEVQNLKQVEQTVQNIQERTKKENEQLKGMKDELLKLSFNLSPHLNAGLHPSALGVVLPTYDEIQDQIYQEQVKNGVQSSYVSGADVQNQYNDFVTQKGNEQIESMKNELLGIDVEGYHASFDGRKERTFNQAQEMYNEIKTKVFDRVAIGVDQIYNNVSYDNTEIARNFDQFGFSIRNASEHLSGFTQFITQLSESSPLLAPLIPLAIALEGITHTLQNIGHASAKVRDFLNIENFINNSSEDAPFKFLNATIEKNSTSAKALITVSNVLGSVLDKIKLFVSQFLGPLALIAGALAVTKIALDWSYKSHEKYVQQLQDETKENRSRSKSLQTITEQSRDAAERNRAPKQQAALDRNYELNRQKLINANLTRTSGAINLTQAQNDTLWGQYGISAALDKIQGKYESTASEYDGTSGQIRRIKEATTGGQDLIRGLPGYFSSAQTQVASYYDSNKLAFGVMDEYKDELGKLYDAETNIMKKDHISSTEARRTKEFQVALDKFVEATGITRDHAKQYLDYMQTEHNVDKAVQAMQAQADKIQATTDMKIQAIQFGGNPADVLGLNGIEAQQNAMVRAQADMIKLETSSALWWKAVWSTITSPVRAIRAPVFAIANILGAIWSFITGNWDAAGISMQRAGANLNVLGETATYWGAWGETEATDFNAIGQGAIDDHNRANYGNVSATPASGGFSHYYGNGKKKGLFGLFGGHGGKEHEQILKQNEQQSFFAQLIGGITAALGTIITILTTGAIISIGTDLLNYVGGLDVVKQSIQKYFPGIIDKIEKIPGFNTIKNIAGRVKGFADPIMSFFGIDKVTDFIGDKIPQPIKDMAGSFFGENFGKIKNFLGLGDSRELSEEVAEETEKDTVEDKEKSVESNVASITEILKNIWDFLKGNGEEGLEYHDYYDPRRIPFDVLSDSALDTYMNGSENEKNHIHDLINPRDILPDFYDIQNTSENAQKRLDFLFDDLTMEVLHDPRKKFKGKMLPNDTLQINAGLLDGENSAANMLELMGVFIHEFGHGGLSHNTRINGEESVVSDELYIDGNAPYHINTAELETRLATQLFMDKIGLPNPKEFDFYGEDGEIRNTLQEDIKEAIQAGTWTNTNQEMAVSFADAMINNKDKIFSVMMNGLEQSQHPMLNEENLGFIKNLLGARGIQLQELNSDVSFKESKNLQRNMARFERMKEKGLLYQDDDSRTPINEEWEWYNNADAINIDDLSSKNQFKASPKTAIKNKLEEVTAPWDDYLAGKVNTFKEKYASPWDNYLSTKMNETSMSILYGQDRQNFVDSTTYANISNEDLERLKEKHNIDTSNAPNSVYARKQVYDELEQGVGWDNALSDLYTEKKMPEVENRGFASIMKEHVANNYVAPWKEYATTQAKSYGKNLLEEAKIYNQDPTYMGKSLYDKENASMPVKLLAKGLQIKDKIFGADTTTTSIKEALQDPAKMEELVKNRLDQFDSDSTIGQYRDKAYKAQEMMQDPQKAMEWVGTKYTHALDLGDEEYQEYQGGNLEYKDLSWANKIRSIKEEHLGMDAQESFSDLLQDPERTVEMGRKLYGAYQNGDLEGTFEGLDIGDTIRSKMAGIFNSEDIKEAVEEGIDEGTEKESGGLFDSAKKKLAGLFGNGEEESVGEKEEEEEIPIKKMGRVRIPIEDVDEDEEEEISVSTPKTRNEERKQNILRQMGEELNTKDKTSKEKVQEAAENYSIYDAMRESGKQTEPHINAENEKSNYRNASQAVKAQMPWLYSGDEIYGEMDTGNRNKTINDQRADELRRQQGEVLERNENLKYKSQAVMAQIDPFTTGSTTPMGQSEATKEESRIKERAYKYGGEANHAKSGEEIAQQEKEARKYYKKPFKTFEEVWAGEPDNVTREDIQAKLDEDNNKVREEINTKKKDLALPQRPKNALSKKGRELQQQAGQKQALSTLGQMMDNPVGTVLDTEAAMGTGVAYCPECGAKNDLDATHCTSCGARMDGRGKITGKLADKTQGIRDKFSNIKDKGASLKSKANRGTIGSLMEKAGSSKAGTALFNGIDNAKAQINNLTGEKYSKQYTIAGKMYKETTPGGAEDKPTVMKLTENEDIMGAGQRILSGENPMDVAGDAIKNKLTGGKEGIEGADNALKTGGNLAQKAGGFLKGKSGVAGKVGGALEKVGGGASKVGNKGIQGVAKGGVGKLAKSGIGKVGGKIASKVGGKLLGKAGAQVASKVLAGGLAATGIGAPLAAVMASPVGGMLMEGAMDLGGKALGAVGGAIGGVGKAVGGLFGMGKGEGHYYGKGSGGGGILGSLGKMSPGLGLMGMAAGGIGGMIGGLFGMGGGGPGNMGKSAGLGGAMKALSPFGLMTDLLGKIRTDNRRNHTKTEKSSDLVGKILKAILDGKANNNKNAPSSNGGNITIQNININTADDPEAIKAMFLELIIELQEQINPRIVSRTTGEVPTAPTEDTTNTDTTDQDDSATTNPNGDNSSGTSTNNTTTQ